MSTPDLAAITRRAEAIPTFQDRDGGLLNHAQVYGTALYTSPPEFDSSVDAEYATLVLNTDSEHRAALYDFLLHAKTDIEELVAVVWGLLAENELLRNPEILAEQILAELPAAREQIMREEYGDAFVDHLQSAHAAMAQVQETGVQYAQRMAGLSPDSRQHDPLQPPALTHAE